MSESEARAQALSLDFVSAMAVEYWGGLRGRTNLALCGFGLIPIVFRQSVEWEDSFQVCYLRSLTKRGIPNQSPGEE